MAARPDRSGVRVRLLAATCLLALSTVSPRADEPATPRRLFVSGHSLTGQPIPDDLARIAASLGQPLAWSRRHGSGLTIAQRACREGVPAVDERSGPDATTGPYDTLVVTEQHDLMGAFLWNDTIGELARLHDCFAARDPGIATWFYVPWISLDDKGDPSAWIAYERAAAPLWRCIVAAANRRSAAVLRGNRIRTIPAASVLATLVERAAHGEPLPGLPAGNPGQAVAQFIDDAVHPTRLASYALALTVYAAATGRPVTGAWAPDTLAPETARALQDFAGRTMVAAEREPEPDPGACAAQLRAQATETFWPYMERAMWRPQSGFWSAWAERLDKSLRWRWRLWRDPAWTPFGDAG